MKKTKTKKQVRRRRGQNRKSLVVIAVFLLVAVVSVAGAFGGFASPGPPPELDLSSWLNSSTDSASSNSGTPTVSPGNDLSSWLGTPASAATAPGTPPVPSGLASLIARLTRPDVLTTIDLGTVATRGATTPVDTIDVDGIPVKADVQGNFFVRVNGNSAIVLRGKAATGAVVRVNGNAIRADASGYFSLRTALEKGSNNLDVTVAAGGNVTTLRLMVSFTP